jgi:protoporphyrinogen oxidase
MNIIIGAGISGLSAGQALDGEFVVLEKSTLAGGLSGQYRAGGFAFDHGGHYFHFQDKPEIKEHVSRYHAFRAYRRDSKIFLGERFIPYSLQYHLAYLPARLRKPILAEILGGGGEPQADLEKFLLANFGRRFFSLFFEPYLLKFYGRPLSGMIAGMDKGSIPVPRLEEVLAGARGKRRFSEGYNPVFYYPVRSAPGFMQYYSRPLLDKIRFSETVMRIEPRQKKLFTTAGAYRYENLITSMPLKELLGIITPPPPFPRQQLQNISTLVVNAVLSRRRRRFHWLYLPESRFPFYRVGYYPGSGTVAVYLEKTIDDAATLDGPQLFRDMAFTLRRIGMVEHESEILFHDLKKIPVSYVVFDCNWPRLVPAVLAYLLRLGIHSIGRYGSWNYSSMADDIQMALATAARINQA